VNSHEEIGSALGDALQPPGRLVVEPDAGARLVRAGRRRVRNRRIGMASTGLAGIAAVAITIGATGLVGNDGRHGAPIPPATAVTPTPTPARGYAYLCVGAPFTLPLGEAASGVLATTAVTSDSYRDILPGNGVVVARGAGGKTVELRRGVDNQDFAVSVYAHGSVPLQPVTVLGSSSDLYPAAVTGASGPRIPFATGADRVDNPCSRWELLATGLTDQQLINYASEVQP